MKSVPLAVLSLKVVLSTSSPIRGQWLCALCRAATKFKFFKRNAYGLISALEMALSRSTEVENKRTNARLCVLQTYGAEMRM